MSLRRYGGKDLVTVLESGVTVDPEGMLGIAMRQLRHALDFLDRRFHSGDDGGHEFPGTQSWRRSVLTKYWWPSLPDALRVLPLSTVHTSIDVCYPDIGIFGYAGRVMELGRGVMALRISRAAGNLYKRRSPTGKVPRPLFSAPGLRDGSVDGLDVSHVHIDTDGSIFLYGRSAIPQGAEDGVAVVIAESRHAKRFPTEEEANEFVKNDTRTALFTVPVRDLAKYKSLDFWPPTDQSVPSLS